MPEAVAGRSRLRGVEGLRAAAAISVLTLHVYLYSPRPGAPLLDSSGVVGRLAANTRDGLMLFFVLSGFLLYRPVVRAMLAGERRPSVRAYARNRVLRIVPAYWVILLATAFVLQTAIISYQPFVVGRLVNVGTLMRDLFFLQTYSVSTVNTGISPAWSLSAEVVFYAVLPLLAIAAASRVWRVSPVRGALLPAGALLALGLSTKLALAIHGTSGSGVSALVLPDLFPALADLFAIGMVAGVVQAAVEAGVWQPGRLLRPAFGIVAALGLALIVAFASIYKGGAPFTDTLVGLVCGCAVLSVCLPGEGRRRVRGLLESRPFVAVGLCSYSVYLWHMPVIFLLRRWGAESDDALTLAGCWAATVACTLLLSAITYRFVEVPALRRKRDVTAVPSVRRSALAIRSLVGRWRASS